MLINTFYFKFKLKLKTKNISGHFRKTTPNPTPKMVTKQLRLYNPELNSKNCQHFYDYIQ